MKISVIVTNWNGLDIIKKSLPRVIAASPEAMEIIFSDDASTDDSVNFARSLAQKHPKLRVIVQKKNVGFVENSNYAVRHCKGALVILLNSDVYPQKGYITSTLRHFKNKNVFGVGLCEVGHENWAKLIWKDGYLQYQPGIEVSKLHITGWLSGGTSIVRRKLFLRLGGFDQVYAPFYSEDVDLGYRAWKSGYTLIWEPKAKVKHYSRSTTSKISHKYVFFIQERNRLLTVWRNIKDQNLLWSNRLAILYRVLHSPGYTKVILAALKQTLVFPPPKVFPKLHDKEIFDKFSTSRPLDP
ncbi:hypothetical protein A2803_02195 [Candidatus Woesebacteria bacterium RIFCSPHIGHO2_01_FULL_44_21]|uniref:Glycosyltransferase 2-like domain-containing protein n=1 Tax=Candidatus Woesebacteria bacterium RIFCSPHIGHO2_01_FULL_44_21 TaxID=1802503 RepID=A0A1F7YWH1_9BACT|nr:MAG: hypothetical protein A2803_02195 [Candidatus Woesebacteria bacterium RIFCSPHIGHO2_01_FULL_44_21]